MSAVVSDTSPIRALASLNLLELLPKLFGQILIPPTVAAELEHPPTELIAVQPRLLNFITIRSPSLTNQLQSLLLELDQGEAEALALAIECNIRPVLLDEAAGRAVAARLGLIPVGVIGILVRAKQLGSIPAVRPLLDQLVRESRFFISEDLRQEAVRQAGE